MEQQYDDEFIGRWLEDQLTDEEYTIFEKTEMYQQYQQILETIDTAIVPNYDLSENFDATLSKIAQDEISSSGKIRKLIPWLSAAASIALLILGYTTFFRSTSHETRMAEQKKMELPDGSTVVLNADSKLDYKSFNWNAHRKVNLQGEAFFKVTKGTSFQVKSSQGTVTVLGTSFTINSRKGFYNIICYEGKVRVSPLDKPSVILTRGEAYSLQGNAEQNYKVTLSKPSWLQGKSYFDTVAIQQVLSELERQYNITIRGKNSVNNANFSGSIPNNNLEMALKTIGSAMQINFRIEDGKNVVITP